MQTVSIVGFGRFGKTLYRLLKDDCEISVYDTNSNAFDNISGDQGIEILSSIESIYKKGTQKNKHTVLFSVPIDAFDRVIREHKKFFSDRHILIDVLSVKMHPKNVFDNYLEGTGIQAILTHPMFGPDSSKEGFDGLPIVLDQYKSETDVYARWKKLFKNKGLRIVELTPEQHDEMAANSQGVTHFIGRLLDEFGMESTPIDTLGAKKLQEVMGQTCNDTWQLFTDLQNFNPFTKRMRLDLGESYDKLYNKLIPDRKRSDRLIFGIQGGRGSFNEQALKDYIERHNIESYDVKYLYTTKAVLEALHMGEIDRGQFAVHNSTGGIVQETIEAVADYKFRIVEEFGIIISHFLMKKPGVATDSIDTIMTHPQVLKQCKATLERKYPNLDKRSGEDELIDHAKVAEALSKDTLGDNIAVMGPEILSSIYDLEIVEGNLQDNKENYTSFLMTARRGD